MVTFPFQPHSKNLALIDGESDRQLTYAQLMEDQMRFAKFYPLERSLVFVFCQNTLDEAACYLAALNQGHVLCLLDARLNPELKQALVKTYSPSLVFDSVDGAYIGYEKETPFYPDLKTWKMSDFRQCPALHATLQLLLSTSGTTGSPKMVRLSKANLVSNARAIVEALEIRANDKAIASLPFHYSYGLSVLHSHLVAGASIVLTRQSVVQKEFWEIVRKHACTSFAGVPYTYEMLERIEVEKMNIPSIQVMTQAGGRLDKRLIIKFDEWMKSRGGKFFVMYGQTEATARITVLPPDLLPAKVGAIGKPIPGGILRIMNGEQEINQPGVIGELVYRGPNVMLGYAETAKDLDLANRQQGLLNTGDLGYVDSDGIFYLQARTKRFAKIYGARINLDQLEEDIKALGPVAVVSDDERIYFCFEQGVKENCEKAIRVLSEKYKIHYSTFQCMTMHTLPRTATGKVNYSQLGAILRNEITAAS
jgi:long-chain acyl-CoA synthetase